MSDRIEFPLWQAAPGCFVEDGPQGARIEAETSKGGIAVIQGKGCGGTNETGPRFGKRAGGTIPWLLDGV